MRNSWQTTFRVKRPARASRTSRPGTLRNASCLWRWETASSDSQSHISQARNTVRSSAVEVLCSSLSFPILLNPQSKWCTAILQPGSEGQHGRFARLFRWAKCDCPRAECKTCETTGISFQQTVGETRGICISKYFLILDDRRFTVQDNAQ